MASEETKFILLYFYSKIGWQINNLNMHTLTMQSEPHTLTEADYARSIYNGKEVFSLSA